MTKNDTRIRYRTTVIAKSAVNLWWVTTRLLSLILFSTQIAHSSGLSLEDQQQANTLAGLIAWPSTSTAQTHQLGLQTLSIEKQEQKNSSGTRLVRVYQYHYAHESARLLIIDLIEQTLVREQTIDTIHLPLNQVEIEYAVSIVADNHSVLEQLHAEQRRRQRPIFTQLSELDIKASIFEPMDSQHPCATQRCALLSLFDDTRTVFSIEPVVYLGAARLELLDKQ